MIIKVSDEIQQEIDAIDAILDTLSKEDWQRAYMLEMGCDRLIRHHGKMLNFGTSFDYGGNEAALRYYEETVSGDAEDKEAQQNRRLLYSVMIRAGLMPYADEWWHYNDPASQMGAKAAGRAYAEYGAAKMSPKNEAFAQMRRLHHVNSVRLARGEEWTPSPGLEAHYTLARLAVRGDNPQNVWRMTSAVQKIEPPRENAA